MKILVVGMVDSVHLARWLQQFAGSANEFLIFPSSPHRRVNSKLRILSARSKQFRIPKLLRIMSLPLWIADRILSDNLRGILLSIYAKKFRPDFVHVLEFQNGGYTYLRALGTSRTLADVPLLLTPYGSDMYWYQRFEKHRDKLKRLLAAANALSCECVRDQKLAAELGFVGIFTPVVPAFGKIEIEGQPKDTHRRKILIKGYQNKWGQAANAIEAISNVSEELRDFELHFFSCNAVTVRLAQRLAKRKNLKVTTYRKGALTHEEMQGLFKTALIYIGLSKSDGISASMIEAMAHGAIPIQSNTSCCGEWLTDVDGGFLVRYDDIEAISRAILSILRSEDFQKSARQRNWEDLKLKVEPEATEDSARETYEIMGRLILAGGGPR